MRKLLTLSVALVCFIGMSYAQRTITGQVTDQAQGEPLIGASIIVKGTTTGTVTDFDGNFSLEVPDGYDVLVFSYTGYSPQEITLGSSNFVDVSLSAGVTLSDVVVTAMGISREQKTLGYAVQELDGDEVSEVRETNFVSSLSGKVAGVSVKPPNTMGGSANIVIRGYSSLTQDNQALFVVDGVPVDNTNTNESRPAANETTAEQNDGWGGYDYGNAAMDINPDDIESISILKGAAASALYGSRAANGVILITTKKGTSRDGIGITINSGFVASSVDDATLPQHQNVTPTCR
jgi:TonB-dependent SusC/RagA subfamily outer membrane receptor